MKLMDRNGRLFGKISVIDVLVILVVAVMAVALRFKSSQVITGNRVPEIPITYQVTVLGVRTYVADAVQEKDLLYDQNYSSSGALGEIVEIRRTPGTRMADMIDGTVDTLDAPDCVNLVLTIRGSGLVNEGRYLLNRVYDLGVNSARNYSTKYALFTGTVTAILSPEMG